MQQKVLLASQESAHYWTSLILEGVEEALFALDTEWRFTYLNRQASALLGVSPESILGVPLWEAFPNVLGSSFEKLYRQAMEKGISGQLEDFYPSRNTWYDLRVYAIPQGLVGHFREVSARKELEQSLQASETRFKVLNEATLEAIIIHDNGIVIDANQNAVTMHGYTTLEEFIGLPLDRIVATESWDEVQQRFTTGSEGVHESIAIRVDGSRFPVEGRGKYITYRGQQMRIVALRDITEQKRAEAELHRQIERSRMQANVSRALAEATQDYQATLDTATYHLAEMIGDACTIWLISDDRASVEMVSSHYVNPEAAALVSNIVPKHDREENSQSFIRQTLKHGQPLLIPSFSLPEIKAIFPPDFWPYLEKFSISSMMIAPLRAGGQMIGAIAMTRNQSERPYTHDDMDLLQDQADRIGLAIANARLFVRVQNELDERMRAEVALRASQERFQALIEHSPDAIGLFDPDGTIVYGSPATTRILGYSIEEFVGRNVFDLIHPNDQAFIVERFTQALDDSATRADAHARVQHKDGSWRFLVGTFINLLDNPSVGAIVANYRDDTERKRLETQLLQVQKMESIGRLAGGIAHDFNNLLTAINGYSELVLSGLEEGHQLYADLLEIQKAGQRAAALTGQLLSLSRQQVLEPQVINLNEVVKDMDKLLHRLIGEDVELLSLLAPTIDAVLADPSQIEQVILNLAVNARDAMPDGGQLTIETANIELDQEYRSAGFPTIKTGRYVMLAITDTGSGMDQATQARIFEPFFTTKPPGKGTGMGLATVYGIVSQSDGYIWVYSEPGQGTTFKIYLPSVRDPAVAQRVAYLEALPTNVTDNGVSQTIALSAERRCTVLVVEDDVLVKELIHRVLTEARYTTLHAGNGQEALELITEYQGQIDVVLTDVVMPQMGGRELIENLRERWSNFRIIGMSGYTDRAVVRHGMLQQCDAFLQKPFTPHILLHRIGEVLQGACDQ